MTQNEIDHTGAVFDLIVIGAGPAGIHAAAEAEKLGLNCLVVDRRGLAHSFVEYPQTLRFFSPPDEMEVGGVPLPMRGGDKPTREDILPYFRGAAHILGLQLALWRRVTAAAWDGATWRLQTVREPDGGQPTELAARALILACGVWDVPVCLKCPGAGLPHVISRFTEPTEYVGEPVLVVGGGNSAVYAALTLAEAHAQVTFAMRRAPVAGQSHLRPFVVRDLEMAVADGRLKLLTGVIAARIEPERTWLLPAEYDAAHPAGGRAIGEPFAVHARFLFALLGQRPDGEILQILGLSQTADGRSVQNSETYETPAPNVWTAGSLAGPKIDIIITARNQTAGVVRRVFDRLRGKADR